MFFLFWGRGHVEELDTRVGFRVRVGFSFRFRVRVSFRVGFRVRISLRGRVSFMDRVGFRIRDGISFRVRVVFEG